MPDACCASHFLVSTQVVVEPYLADTALHFSVTVLESPLPGGPPLALSPTEVEVEDVEEAIFKSELALREWQLMQVGLNALLACC